MKKILMGTAAAALLLTIGVTGAFAAGPGWGQRVGGGTGCRFADADGNGVCDYCGETRTLCAGGGQYFVDADGNGVCDNCGRTGGSCGAGRYCTDINNDGVCDHYAAGSGHHGQGRGAHRGCGR